MRRRRYSVSYFLSTGLKSFGRNWFMNLSAIVILISAMIICGSFMLVFFNINHNIEQLNDFNEILVYARLDANDEKLAEMQTKIESLNTQVSGVNIKCELITKEQSLENERKKYEQNGGSKLFERYDKDGQNPLPDTFKVTFDNVENFEIVKAHLSTVPYVLDITSHKEIADRVNQVKNMILIVCAALALILIAVSLLIISNTIKLALKSREDEIIIMRYIGATNYFITMPYVVEACVVAFISTAIAFAAEYFAYDYIVRKITENYSMISVYPTSAVWMYLLAGFASVTLCVCVFGSIAATRRCMKA